METLRELFDKYLVRKWWGLGAVYLALIVTIYGVLWYLIEPIGISDEFPCPPSFARWRWFYHVIVTITLSSLITIGLELWFRKGNWAIRSISKDELENFNCEMRELLIYISKLHGKTMDTKEIQNLVEKTVSVASKIHFDGSIPLTISGSFKEGKYGCPVCHCNKEDSLAAEVSGSGQCKKCKLAHGYWNLPHIQ